jgi:hypothetical protein
VTTEFRPNLFEFGDVAGSGQWLVGHFRQHLNYNNVLAARTPAVVLAEFPILTMEGGHSGRRSWLNSHENWHELVRPFANVTGIDLSTVNLDNEQQFYEWLDIHNFEHSLLDLAFGIA